ncbi:FAD-dependent oxidoreductase [Microbacterium aquimaris]|uniref:NAD(P)/FAD-dependent oxidoreductase n=1 Tax=Microbacterium aquimaris TaxID=459816 RepID=A0ABU5N4B0_9MICO|nr:NAD(P)/FAD-dependent oxidoreductase [Microbacterium aquimaris]MDZ8160934.1 NAD(P)/FAD-dependent oxidoreductase [Microbacterium aquimaris]
MSADDRLRRLEAEVARDIALTSYPTPEWVRSRSTPDRRVLDVLIIGAGQAGLALAFALRRRAVTEVEVWDEAEEGREGPWVTYAKMRTLRTPKHLTGPDQGVPSLTPEAWYRARYGDTAWEQLRFIPKEHWQEYLGWFRRVTAAPVRNGVRATGIRPDGDLMEVRAVGPDGEIGRTWARRVILATGMAGNGRWSVPGIIAENLPEDRYDHTGAPLDTETLRGKRIGVLGGGASAFDYAGEALETGAHSVDLFYRRAEIPRVNPFRWMEFYAFGAHFPDLSDDDKWRFTARFQQTNQPVPQYTWDRCARFAQFSWHVSSPWESVALVDGEIEVRTPTGTFRFDHVIAGTGPSVELEVRPELAELAPRIARWRDRYQAPDEWKDDALAEYPYLGSGFEFLPRDPADAWVSRVYDFTYGARLSMGLNGNMNSGLGAGARRLGDAVSRSLFVEDADAFFDSYRAYDTPELVEVGRPDA